MKRIELKSITLTGWRGEMKRTTVFSSGDTVISGKNGVGKSRHFDAFCWLLFGKDRLDRKNFEIRTYDPTAVLQHKTECSVEAVLLVGGQEITLKRAYNEKWVKPHGATVQEFVGYQTECLWNGTPVKVGDFDNRVKTEIVDDTMFKMITNPRFFFDSMHWENQREALLQMAGTATDEEICQKDKEFRALLDRVSGKPLADWKKEQAYERKRLQKELDEIQPRIDATVAMMPEPLDWEDLTQKRGEYRVALDDINGRLKDYSARMDARQGEIKEIYSQVSDLWDALQQDLFQAQKSAQQVANEANARRQDIGMDLKRAHELLSRATIDHKRAEERITSLQKELDAADRQLETLRARFREIRAMQFRAEGVCPHCGQPMPAEHIAAAREAFLKEQKRQLDANVATGQLAADRRKEIASELEVTRRQRDEYADAVKDHNEHIARLQEQFDACPLVTAREVTVDDVTDGRKREKQINDLRDRARQMSAESDDAEMADRLRSQANDLLDKLEHVNSQLAKRQQIEHGKHQVDKLEARGKELAQMIADIEHWEDVATNFQKSKIAECEGRINRMFTLVKFRLFNYTLDSGEYECCIPLVGGVPYSVANTAGQLNAGLDVINTLCRYNDISAPIFIDGAESVNEYIDTAGQRIFLKVTDEEELTVSILS